MIVLAAMSHPPHGPYSAHGYGQEYGYGVPPPQPPSGHSTTTAITTTTARPAYPPITTTQLSPYQNMPLQQPFPYPFEQPSPVHTSPAYTPAPHIMQYLSPPPSHQTQSPVIPQDASSGSRGRAVVVGINYFNQKGEMKGRVDEARNLSRYLQQVKRYRKEDIILLSDDQNGPYSQPTKKNILAALIWLAKQATPGEKLLLYYSGHGRVSMKEKKQRGGGNRSCSSSGRRRVSRGNANGNAGGGGGGADGTGKDQDDTTETIYPADFRSFKDGMITPEDLDEILQPAKDKGARLTIILDTHAGTRR